MLQLVLTATADQLDHDWGTTLIQLGFTCGPFTFIVGFLIWALVATKKQQRAVTESIELQRQAKGWHEETVALAREQIRLLRKLAGEPEPPADHERLAPPTEPT